MSDKLKLESANCATCGRQVWAGVRYNQDMHIHARLPVEFLGGTLEQDETGALMPSKAHQYQIHICQGGENDKP